MTMLEFGYTGGLPEATETVRGCRAVIADDNTVHVVRDRTSAVGPESGRLLTYLHDLPLRGDWQDRASGLLHAGLMNTRLDEEFVLYSDDVRDQGQHAGQCRLAVRLRVLPAASRGSLYCTPACSRF